MLCACRRTMPGCVRILRDSKEAFREANAAAHRCSKTPSRDASTLAEKQVAAAFRSKEVVSDGGVVGEKPPSSRSSPGRGKVAGALGLKEFMHRTKVLDLYRGILKRARAVEDKDVAIEVRRQFRTARDETDPLKIQMLVADASNQLEAMQGTARGGTSGAGGGASWLDIDDPEDQRGRVGQGFPWQR